MWTRFLIRLRAMLNCSNQDFSVKVLYKRNMRYPQKNKAVMYAVMLYVSLINHVKTSMQNINPSLVTYRISNTKLFG